MIMRSGVLKDLNVQSGTGRLCRFEVEWVAKSGCPVDSRVEYCHPMEDMNTNIPFLLWKIYTKPKRSLLIHEKRIRYMYIHIPFA